MDDPTDRKVVDELARSTGLALTVITSSHEAIKRAFKRLYEEPQPAPVEGDTELIELVADDGPRSRMSDEFRQTKTADSVVRRLLATAIERRCSDIHVETLANRLQVRFRIDGVLEHLDVQELVDACNDSPREIVSRFKILAKLDISERRRPQDGSFRVKVDRGGERRDIDLRLSVVPSHFGEGIVVRVLDRQNVPTSIDSLDFPPAMTDALRQLLARPNGIFLVTGPTGSGKSTTLYASLSTLYRPGIRILTAEDPVEYIYEQFSQSEVNQAIGNTFASYLRAFLRHDPEVIMVGEIRDTETAEMAFRAAQTGHLLLSTLHTNSAIGAVPRLLDLDVDPNTLASSIVGVIGQRLLRKVCDGCRVERVPSADLLEAFFGGIVPDGLKLYAGDGCQACNFTGYRGRCTIVELWVPSEHDILLINQNVPFEQIRASAANSTFTMADTAWERLASGKTNLEELVRVMPYLAVTDFRERYGRSLAAA
jgi:type IV pilus assembly protein PilB